MGWPFGISFSLAMEAGDVAPVQFMLRNGACASIDFLTLSPNRTCDKISNEKTPLFLRRGLQRGLNHTGWVKKRVHVACDWLDRGSLGFVAACGCEAWHDLDQWADRLEAGRVDRGRTQLKVLLACASCW